jgi:hypothetical protein
MLQLWKPSTRTPNLWIQCRRQVHPNTSQEFRRLVGTMGTHRRTQSLDVKQINYLLNNSHIVSESRTRHFITRNVNEFHER